MSLFGATVVAAAVAAAVFVQGRTDDDCRPSEKASETAKKLNAKAAQSAQTVDAASRRLATISRFQRSVNTTSTTLL